VLTSNAQQGLMASAPWLRQTDYSGPKLTVGWANGKRVKNVTLRSVSQSVGSPFGAGWALGLGFLFQCSCWQWWPPTRTDKNRLPGLLALQQQMKETRTTPERHRPHCIAFSMRMHTCLRMSQGGALKVKKVQPLRCATHQHCDRH
jgi:hypothetical protein